MELALLSSPCSTPSICPRVCCGGGVGGAHTDSSFWLRGLDHIMHRAHTYKTARSQIAPESHSGGIAIIQCKRNIQPVAAQGLNVMW